MEKFQALSRDLESQLKVKENELQSLSNSLEEKGEIIQST